MSFLRQDALALIRRWFEPALAGIVAAVLVWVSMRLFLRGDWLGLAMAAFFGFGGAVWFRAAWRKARFGDSAGGPGVVIIEERRIGYMGPAGGGFADIAAISQVAIVTTDQGPFIDDLYWVIAHDDDEDLIIPGSAEGTSGLFEAFTVLPDFDYAQAVTAAGSAERAHFTLWRRNPAGVLRELSRPPIDS